MSLYAWCNNSHTACSSYLKIRYLDALCIFLSATSELELEPPRNNIYHWVIIHNFFAALEGDGRIQKCSNAFMLQFWDHMSNFIPYFCGDLEAKNVIFEYWL